MKDLEPASLTNILQHHDLGDTSGKILRGFRGNIIRRCLLKIAKIKWQDYSTGHLGKTRNVEPYAISLCF